MELEGGYTLTPEQVAAWIAKDETEYNEYVEAELFNPETLELLEAPSWMDDGDPTNGPFDFKLNPSHGTGGW